MCKHPILSVLSFLAFIGAAACGVESPAEISEESSLAAAKATAAVGDIAILNQTQLDWSTVMSRQLKTSNRNLFIDVSLECGLLTETIVRSQRGRKDTSTADAAVMVRVLVDGQAASPGPVVFCQRTQELSATLSGILESCTDANGDGTILASECDFTDEEISLLLSTMNANSFNFATDTLSSGTHTIAVEAMIRSSTSVDTGSARAEGSIGKGAVEVTAERLAKGDSISF